MGSVSRSLKVHQDHLSRLFRYGESETDGSSQDDLCHLKIIASLGTNDDRCEPAVAEHEIRQGEQLEERKVPFLRSNLSGMSCSQQQLFAESSTLDSNDVLGYVIIGNINSDTKLTEESAEQDKTQNQSPDPQLPSENGKQAISCDVAPLMPIEKNNSRQQMTSENGMVAKCCDVGPTIQTVQKNSLENGVQAERRDEGTKITEEEPSPQSQLSSETGKQTEPCAAEPPISTGQDIPKPQLTAENEMGTERCDEGAEIPEQQPCDVEQGQTQDEIPQKQLPLATGMPREPCATGSQVPSRQESPKPQPSSELFVEERKDDVIEIFVKALTGNTGVYRVKGTDLVGDLMKQIEEKTDLEESHQRLSYCGKPLEEDQYLNDYHIQNHATVVLGMRVHGGHFHSTTIWI